MRVSRASSARTIRGRLGAATVQAVDHRDVWAARRAEIAQQIADRYSLYVMTSRLVPAIMGETVHGQPASEPRLPIVTARGS